MPIKRIENERKIMVTLFFLNWEVLSSKTKTNTKYPSVRSHLQKKIHGDLEPFQTNYITLKSLIQSTDFQWQTHNQIWLNLRLESNYANNILTPSPIFILIAILHSFFLPLCISNQLFIFFLPLCITNHLFIFSLSLSRGYLGSSR